MENKPKTLVELKQLRRPVKNVNEEHENNLSAMDKLAVWITDHVGSMGFFMIILIWTILWLGWNMFAPAPAQFDPFPAFVLWLFISNMIQIFLMPLIMVGQNLQNRHSEARAQADYEVNVKAELEIETILHHLENQNELIIKIVKQIEDGNALKK